MIFALFFFVFGTLAQENLEEVVVAFDDFSSQQEVIFQEIPDYIKKIGPITKVRATRFDGDVKTLMMYNGIETLQEILEQPWMDAPGEGNEGTRIKYLTMASDDKEETLYIMDDNDISYPINDDTQCALTCENRQVNYTNTQNGLISFGAPGKAFASHGGCCYTDKPWIANKLDLILESGLTVTAFDDTLNTRGIIYQRIPEKVMNLEIEKLIATRADGIVMSTKTARGILTLKDAFTQEWKDIEFGDESDRFKPLGEQQTSNETTLFILDDHDVYPKGEGCVITQKLGCNAIRQTEWKFTPNGLITFGANQEFADPWPWHDYGTCAYCDAKWVVKKLEILTRAPTNSGGGDSSNNGDQQGNNDGEQQEIKEIEEETAGITVVLTVIVVMLLSVCCIICTKWKDPKTYVELLNVFKNCCASKRGERQSTSQRMHLQMDDTQRLTNERVVL